jgi:hypothetical protein
LIITLCEVNSSKCGSEVRSPRVTVTKYTVPPTPTVVTTEPTTKYTVPPTPTVGTTKPTRKYTVPTTSNVMTTSPMTAQSNVLDNYTL